MINRGKTSDSPRPQSGPLNPKKQWQVPAMQSPFPKQLLGQSSIESARQQSKDFLSNVVWKTIFPPTHFLWVDYYPFANDGDEQRSDPVNISFSMQNISSVTNVSPKYELPLKGYKLLLFRLPPKVTKELNPLKYQMYWLPNWLFYSGTQQLKCRRRRSRVSLLRLRRAFFCDPTFTQKTVEHPNLIFD